MAYTIKKFGDHRERRDYSKTKNKVALGNLLEIQKDSYEEFITKGIEEVLTEISPVESFTGNLSLEFGDFSFEKPRYSIKDCKERYATYAALFMHVEWKPIPHESKVTIDDLNTIDK